MEQLTMRAVCYLAENAGINVLKGDEIDSSDPRTLTALYVALQLDSDSPPTMDQAMAMNPSELFEKVAELLGNTEEPGKPVKKRASRKKPSTS